MKELIYRLSLKFNVKVFNENMYKDLEINLEKVKSSFGIHPEVVMKCIFRYCREHGRPLNLRYDYKTMDSIVSVINRSFEMSKMYRDEKDSIKYFSRTDIDKIHMYMKHSSEVFLRLYTEKDITYYRYDSRLTKWWKSCHLPWVMEYGYPDSRIKKLLFSTEFGRQVRNEYDKMMGKYNTEYWIKQLIRRSNA